MDHAGEYTPKTRTPRDDFETEMFRRHIQADAKRWYVGDEIRITVGVVCDDEGAFSLYIWEPNDDPLRIMEPKGEMRGKVWLSENEYPVSEYYRVQVWHHIEEQSPNYGHPPIIPWEVAAANA